MASPQKYFGFGERLGLFFTFQGAFVSIVAVMFILYLAFARWRKRRSQAKLLAMLPTTSESIIEDDRPPDAIDSSLFLNLMFADIIQALGTIFNIRWVALGTVITGEPVCIAQSATKQIGIVGVSLTSLCIGVHTFAVLVLGWKGSKHASKLIIAGIWVATAAIMGIPWLYHKNEVYYGRTGYWCWIVNSFKAEQIVTEYLWVWTACLTVIVLYVFMFAVMKKIIPGPASGTDTPEDLEFRDAAGLMLYYPAVYLFCILPNTCSRWLYFSGRTLPYQYTLFANTVFALSGFFNVLLFFYTRPAVVVGMNHPVVEQPVPPQQPVIQQRRPRGNSDGSTRRPASPKFGSLPSRRRIPSDNTLQGIEETPSSPGLTYTFPHGRALSPSRLTESRINHRPSTSSTTPNETVTEESHEEGIELRTAPFRQRSAKPW